MQALKEAITGKRVAVVGNSTKIAGEDHVKFCNEVDYVLRMQRGVLRDDIRSATGNRCDIYVARKPLWCLEDSIFDTPKYRVWSSPDKAGSPSGVMYSPQEWIKPLVDELGSYPTQGVRAIDMCLRFGATPVLIGFGFYSPECNEEPASHHNGDNERRWCESRHLEIR